MSIKLLNKRFRRWGKAPVKIRQPECGKPKQFLRSKEDGATVQHRKDVLKNGR